MEVGNQKLVEDHLESNGNCDPEMTRKDEDLIVLPSGCRTRLWLCGGMKELDFIWCGGGQGCSIPFTRFQLHIFAARMTSKILFEDATPA